MTLVLVDYVRLVRPRQWVKNLFVFAPLLFSLHFFEAHALLNTSLMFGVFCLAASAVYSFNDVMDREHDRHHPQKRTRPVASGAIAPSGALTLAAILGAAAIGGASLLGPLPGAIVAGYLVVNVVYSLFLRNELFLDVLVIAAGFLLRIAAGSSAVGVQVSSWMFLTTFFLALFLGFTKRRSEMNGGKGSRRHRALLTEFNGDLINCLIVISASLTIITYSLYVLLSASMQELAPSRFVFTIPVVVFGVFRYLYLVYRRSAGPDLAEVILKDRPMLITMFVWIGSVVLLLSWTLLERGGS